MINALWHQFIKSAYRKEPISSFIIIVGVVDALIGGFGERWSLLSFGLMMVVLAAALRWWHQRQEEELSEQPVTRFLPPSQSPPPQPLPMLSTTKRQPPRSGF